MKAIRNCTALLLAIALLVLSGCGNETQNNKESDGMQIINVNQDNFQEVVLNSDKPVLLDFWAPWCGPCRMVGPILEEIAEEREDVKICKVNVDEEGQLASQFGVVSIPLLVVMDQGKIVAQSVGAKPKAEIEAMLP